MLPYRDELLRRLRLRRELDDVLGERMQLARVSEHAHLHEVEPLEDESALALVLVHVASEGEREKA